MDPTERGEELNTHKVIGMESRMLVAANRTRPCIQRAARRPAGLPLHELRASRYLARTARHEACTARVYVCVRESVCY